MDLNEINVFIQVVKAGSFTAAGKKMDLPISTVSFKVSSLEKRLGVTLIQRTTRKLIVTPVGQAFYKKCLQGLEEIAGAELEIAQIQNEPQGLFRITAPVEFASGLLPAIMKEYAKAFPKIRQELVLSDRVIDLLSENVDLAIRAGNLKDSSLIAKKIGEVSFVLVATKKYLSNNSAIHHPKDLWKQSCLQFTPMGYQDWILTSSKGTVIAPVSGKIIINDLVAIKNLALSDAGVALLPYHYCFSELNNGKLVRVLEEWQTKGVPLHFVYPAHKFVTPKLSEFIKIADRKIKEVLF